MSKNTLPDDDALLAFIMAADTPPKIREIASHFGCSPADRPYLRAKLRALAEAGSLPAKSDRSGQDDEDDTPSGVQIVRVMALDSDGYGEARPAANIENGPTITVMPVRAHGYRQKRAHQAFNVGDNLLVRIRKGIETEIVGDVIRVLPKRQDHLFGRLFRKGGRWMIESTEKGASRSLPVSADDESVLTPDMLVKAALIPRRGRAEPTAKIIELIGHIQSPDALVQLAVAEFELPHEFSAEILDKAAAAAVPDLGDRVDLRDTPLVTIDGADAKDFDDAVFAEPAADGGWRLIVAIADVSAYVPADSAMDKEAMRRGNSVYLPGTVIPMLPEALSNGVCSLVPHEPRACLAVEILIDKYGRKVSHQFMRGLMRSHARLTYDAVQQVMDGVMDEADITAPIGSIYHLSAAFSCLKSARDARGTLNLNIKERRAEIDENRQLTGITLREQKPAHQLIEEFMILANVCAAETLEAKRQICVYRNHDRPDPEKLEALYELTESLSLPFAKGQVVQPDHFNQLLAKVSGTPEEQMVNETILRCQARAHYEIDNVGHYGLSLVRYAHFTSPIRRYADLMVHRALITACALGSDGQSNSNRDTFKQSCAHISKTEVIAARAERRTTDRLAASLYSGAEGRGFTAIITGVNKAGLFVSIDEGIAEGFIPRRTLPDDRYEITGGGLILTGLYTGWRFALGDELQAQLKEATPANGGLLLSWRGGGNQVLPEKTGRKSKSKRPVSRGRKAGRGKKR